LDEEKNSDVISYSSEYDDFLTKNFMKTYNTDGLEFIDQEILKKQRGVMSYMIKKIGGNILSGKSIMNVPLPIYIFDTRTALET
jgi:hypothetical protein